MYLHFRSVPRYLFSLSLEIIILFRAFNKPKENQWVSTGYQYQWMILVTSSKSDLSNPSGTLHLYILELVLWTPLKSCMMCNTCTSARQSPCLVSSTSWKFSRSSSVKVSLVLPPNISLYRIRFNPMDYWLSWLIV